MSGYKIPIGDKSEIDKFGFDGANFVKMARDKIGGFEWHGPCPVCGGTDRLTISNGFFNCRNSSTCGTKGKLQSKIDNWREPNQKEIRKQQEQIEKRKKRELTERRNKIRKLTSDRIWETYHYNLLQQPEIITDLRNDGIPMRAIKHFNIGYNPSFFTYVNDKKYTSPTITFPIFRKKYCVNVRHRIMNPIAGDKYRPHMAGLGISFLPAFFKNSDYVVIVEGEKKAIVLWANGIPAIALFGVHCFKEEWGKWVKERFSRSYIAFDMDNEQVKTAAMNVAHMSGAKILNLGGKPDDLIVQGELTIPKLIEEIVRAEG